MLDSAGTRAQVNRNTQFDANAAGPSDFWMITDSKPRPIFYSFVAWAKMGNVVIGSSSDANPHDVASYATKKGNGSIQALLINKTSSSHDVTLTFQGVSLAGKMMYVDRLEPSSAGSDTGGSVLWNGAKDPMPGSLPAGKTTTADASPMISVPAYSIALATFDP